MTHIKDKWYLVDYAGETRRLPQTQLPVLLTHYLEGLNELLLNSSVTQSLGSPHPTGRKGEKQQNCYHWF